MFEMSQSLESPKHRHPAIRRASWNPDADNVAGKAVVRQPRKGELMTVMMMMMIMMLCQPLVSTSRPLS